MKRNKTQTGIIVLMAVAVLAACPSSPDNGGNRSTNLYTKTYTENNIDLQWEAINSAIKAEGKYVILDLSTARASAL